MNKPSDAKFKPGFGKVPPEFAGRDDEMAVIAETLDDLGARSCPAANIALIGPRGNGKTSLLRWVQTQIDRHEDGIECVVLSADRFSSHHDLVDALATHGVFSALAGDGFQRPLSYSVQKLPFRAKGPRKNCLDLYWKRNVPRTAWQY